jgi:ribonuclease E
MAIDVVRTLLLASHTPKVDRVTVWVHSEVATYLNNKKRKELTRIEEDGNINIQVLGKEDLFPEHLEIQCRDADGREVKLPS